MIADIFSDLWSVRFGAGVLVGMAVQRAWCFAQARWLDKRRPLASGKRRRIGGLNKVYLVGAAVAVVLAYQIAEAQRLSSCQQEFAEVLSARSAITVENDRLSSQERTAFANWLRDLLNPPPDIAALDPNSDERQAWALQRSQFYYGQIAAAEAEQAENEREAAPIPDPTCGRG